MLIVCPGCKTQFSFDEQKVGADGLKLRCSKCKSIFRVVRKNPLPDAVPLSESAPPGQLPRIKVVVANESPAFCKAVSSVLASEPFDVFTFNDGREAMTAITQMKPDVVLLDVALPSMYGFEVCEAIRKDPAIAGIKIILIASIYDKTRYKRAPQSLYGADDYIEKHHIPDTLAVMIYRLLSGQKPVEASPEARPAAEEEVQGAAAGAFRERNNRPGSYPPRIAAGRRDRDLAAGGANGAGASRSPCQGETSCPHNSFGYCPL